MLAVNPFAPQNVARQAVKTVSSLWWMLLIYGLLSIIAGGLILAINWTVDDLATFIGVLLVVRGIFTMTSFPLVGGRGTTIVLGLIEVGVGIAVFVWQEPTLLVIAAFIGWWILFRGTMLIAGSIAARSFLPYWGLLLAVGIVETVFAFWLLGEPGITLVATVLALGLWSLIYGVMEIAVAFELKALPSRFDGALEDNARMSMSDTARTARAS